MKISNDVRRSLILVGLLGGVGLACSGSDAGVGTGTGGGDGGSSSAHDGGVTGETDGGSITPVGGGDGGGSGEPTGDDAGGNPLGEGGAPTDGAAGGDATRGPGDAGGDGKANDRTCAAESTREACVTCCEDGHADGYTAYAKALGRCACQANTCADECKTSLCAATPAKPDATCSACLNGTTGAADAGTTDGGRRGGGGGGNVAASCTTVARAACLGNASCSSYALCAERCPAK